MSIVVWNSILTVVVTAWATVVTFVAVGVAIVLLGSAWIRRGDE